MSGLEELRAVAEAATDSQWAAVARVRALLDEWTGEDPYRLVYLGSTANQLRAALAQPVDLYSPGDADVEAVLAAITDPIHAGGCHYRHQQGETDECNSCTAHHIETEAAAALAPLLDERVRVAKAEAWDEGHRDGCGDHLCEQMGHLDRNPYDDQPGRDAGGVG